VPRCGYTKRQKLLIETYSIGNWGSDSSDSWGIGDRSDGLGVGDWGSDGSDSWGIGDWTGSVGGDWAGSIGDWASSVGGDWTSEEVSSGSDGGNSGQNNESELWGK
jgi:hypothetical protein